MRTRLTRSIVVAAEVVVIAASVYAAVAVSKPSEWHPIGLVLLLAAICIAGDWLRLTVRGLSVSMALPAFVLTISLLGLSPAIAIAAASAIAPAVVRKEPVSVYITDTANRMLTAVIGSTFIWLVLGHQNNASADGIDRAYFALLVFAVYLVTNTANFMLVAFYRWSTQGESIPGQLREAFIPMLPGAFVSAALTSVLAVAYSHFTVWSVTATVIVLVIVTSLMSALSRSEERADQLEARTIHLASLQFGVLATLVETLALRDRSTARHSAAVARYARELAKAADCDESVQELAHTAGLLHDIGKFALPDRVLHADILSDADWALIRRHPQEGATLVGRLDGYGAVAEAILYHHERVDGDGYPVGLIGTEIPLVARMIAIASTFDTLTARDTYRTPMSPQDAIAELRRVAGRQLDAELVEIFVTMIESEGRIDELYAGEASFEDELEFGRRVKEIATSAT